MISWRKIWILFSTSICQDARTAGFWVSTLLSVGMYLVAIGAFLSLNQSTILVATLESFCTLGAAVCYFAVLGSVFLALDEGNIDHHSRFTEMLVTEVSPQEIVISRVLKVMGIVTMNVFFTIFLCGILTLALKNQLPEIVYDVKGIELMSFCLASVLFFLVGICFVSLVFSFFGVVTKSSHWRSVVLVLSSVIETIGLYCLASPTQSLLGAILSKFPFTSFMLAIGRFANENTLSLLSSFAILLLSDVILLVAIGRIYKKKLFLYKE